MKWFFALNQSSGNFNPFADMVKVAVHTASLNTSLEPHFLYDGDESDLTAWLRGRGVKIIKCRSRLYPQLAKIAEARREPHVLNIGAGAFLRTEIPDIAASMGWSDPWVLYTDCDVMFLKEVVVDFSKMSPANFSVGPEGDPNDTLHMNTGVMLMNVRQMQKHLPRFEKFMLKHLDLLTRGSWDQTAYMWFYNPMMRLMLACGMSARLSERIFYGLARRKLATKPHWDNLPATYNWKPYWSDFASAKIVHFHGPKPYERRVLESENPPAHLKHLQALIKGGYHELASMWDQYLADAEESAVMTGSAA